MKNQKKDVETPASTSSILTKRTTSYKPRHAKNRVTSPPANILQSSMAPIRKVIEERGLSEALEKLEQRGLSEELAIFVLALLPAGGEP